MMPRRFPLVLALAFSFAPAVEAHFLFARVLPPAEGGRFAEVYFSELAEAGDPRFIEKISATKLWLQTTPGKFEPLVATKAADRLRAHVPANGSVCVVGSCAYGVLTRKPPFLLRHFPKAVAGKPEELNRMQPLGKLPLEIVPTFSKDEVRFVALLDGKPFPGAEFITVDAALVNTKLTADAKGEAVWKPAASGVYSVYTRHTRKEAGEAGGKKYEEIRDFATVAFTWPLVRGDADPAAVALFEEAVAARAQWEKFPGFRARIKGAVVGRPFAGSVAIDAAGAIDFSDDDPSHQETVSAWVEEQFGSIVLHRLARPARPGKAKPIVRFAEGKADDPLGRLLIFDGGKFASSYRIKDKQIAVVNRNLGAENMTITIVDNDTNPEGRSLSRSYIVHYWDAASGRLLRTETVQDRWQRLGAWDLPAFHQVSASGDTGMAVRNFTLFKHELMK
ncbi:MAG: DUF3386 family protein [Gemmataceae bacterium]